MSVVSGITLMMRCGEEDALPALNAWLDAHEITARFTDVTDAFGGNKRPQTRVYGSGLNFFNEDAFADEIGCRPWQYPANVVLVIQPENGPTRIWRFTEGQAWAELPRNPVRIENTELTR